MLLRKSKIAHGEANVLEFECLPRQIKRNQNLISRMYQSTFGKP